MDGTLEKNQFERPDIVPGSSLSDLISLEAVVNVLVRKGICTAEELFEEERKRKHHSHKVKNLTVVQTGDELSQRGRGSSKRHRSWLKRKMSKRRWTRKLGTALFGWQWKKVKRTPLVKEFERD